MLELSQMHHLELNPARVLRHPIANGCVNLHWPIWMPGGREGLHKAKGALQSLQTCIV